MKRTLIVAITSETHRNIDQEILDNIEDLFTQAVQTEIAETFAIVQPICYVPDDNLSVMCHEYPDGRKYYTPLEDLD